MLIQEQLTSPNTSTTKTTTKTQLAVNLNPQNGKNIAIFDYHGFFLYSHSLGNMSQQKSRDNCCNTV